MHFLLPSLCKREGIHCFFRQALLLISELLAATEEVTRLDFTEVDTAPRMMRPQARFPVACLDERPESLAAGTTCRPRQHGELFPAFCKTLAALAIRGPTQGISLQVPPAQGHAASGKLSSETLP